MRRLPLATIAYCLCSLWAAFYAGWPHTKQIQVLQSAVGELGIAVIVLLFLATGMRFSIALRAVAAYLAAIFLIGHFGDDVFEYAVADPKSAAVCVAAIGVLWIIKDVALFPPCAPAPVCLQAQTIVAQPMPTMRDRRFTAAHEAAHALVFAARRPIPPDFCAHVKAFTDDGVLGFVKGVASVHTLVERTFAEWCMLMSLAGNIGEEVVLGKKGLGGLSDNAYWQNVASTYLANGTEGVFYAIPTDKFQHAHNVQKMETLYARHMKMLVDFFHRNSGVLKELASALETKHEMRRDELMPFLDRVVIPGGFPSPTE